MGRQTTLQLPPELDQAIDAIVHREGGTAQDVIREAVREYIAIRQFRLLRDQLMHDGNGPASESDVADHVS